MDDETLKALREEIERWEMIIDEEGVDVRNSPLCDLFLLSLCIGCPVVTIGGARAGCQDSPYWNWVDHQLEEHGKENGYKVYCATCKKLAQKELDFLKSLLPKEEK